MVPDAVWTVAVKPSVDPTVRETVAEGLRLMCPGKRGGPGWDPPPHPVMAEIERTATATRKPNEPNLPMHSSFCIV